MPKKNIAQIKINRHCLLLNSDNAVSENGTLLRSWVDINYFVKSHFIINESNVLLANVLAQFIGLRFLSTSSVLVQA